MVKVTDEPMAEAKPATSTSPSAIPSSISSPAGITTNSHVRKPRAHNHTHHIHQYHYTYLHHHCNHPDSAEAPANGTSPAKFYFGPGFEPQSQIPGGGYCPGPSGQNHLQNGNEYVVLFHVNPGVTIRFQIGDSLEILRGPVTVPMVSTNNSPPIAMPVQVPPGHVVQQIVDESGTLRHVILSPQPAGLVPLTSHNPQHYGAGPGNSTNPPQQFYQGLPAGYPPSQFHSSIPPGHPGPSPTHPGHSPPSNPNYYKDERTQRQYIKLKKKIQDKQKLDRVGVGNKEFSNGLRKLSTKEKDMNSVGTSEDGEESSIPDEEDSVQAVADILSSVQAPKVSELSSRSALLLWGPPTRLSEASPTGAETPEINVSRVRYEVLLSDKSKEMKFKSIYSGNSLSCRIQDLRPGQEYSVCLQAHYLEMQGSATDPVKFTTPPCEPDQPLPPKLHQRQKNSLHLKWNTAVDNGSHIIFYILEYDEGKGADFTEFHRGRVKQYTLHKLQPATAYRFRLAAVNEVGRSAYSDVVTYSTCNNPPTRPPPPVLLAATVNSLHLTWNRRQVDDEFTLQLNDPWSSYRPVYNGRDTHCVCSHLTSFTEYRFRLRAENDGGSSPWSDEVAYRTQPDRPARPSKPVVKGRIHAHWFKLKWEPPSETGGAEINQYLLEVNSGSGYESVYSGNETEAVCDKLTPGTTYQLRVSCVSSGGQSNYSDPCTVTTDAISPGDCLAPKLHGKPKSTSLTFRWTEPDYNGGAPVLEYEVKMSSAGAEDEIVHKSKEMECTVTSLSPGCEYLFSVRAVNRIGGGPWSDPLRVTSGAAPPDIPAPPTTTCRSPFHVFVEWSEPHHNGAPVLEYRLEQSAKSAEEGFHQVYQGPDRSHEVKGLSPATAYHFRVQACNSAGASMYSPIVAAVTPAAPPATPTNLRSEPTPTSLRISWTEPCDHGSPLTRYILECGDTVTSLGAPCTAYCIENLTPDTSYKVRIQAGNEMGLGPLSSVLRTATLRLPPAAPRLECIASAHNYLKLKWGDGKNLDYTQYSVEMENLRSREFQCVYKGTAFTYKVNKLQERTQYRFRISASNDAGQGDYSDVFEFETGLAPPSVLKPPKIVEVEQRSCHLEWLPGKNTFSDPVVYQLQVARTKEHNFRQIYKGPDSKYILDDLEPGTEYSARVCPVRQSADNGELLGPYSPLLYFTTVAAEPVAVSKSAPHLNAVVHTHHRRSLGGYLSVLRKTNFFSERKAVFYTFFIGLLGICLSLWVTSFF